MKTKFQTNHKTKLKLPRKVISQKSDREYGDLYVQVMALAVSTYVLVYVLYK